MSEKETCETCEMKPKMKQELLIKRCPAPRVISFDICTKRAEDWLIKASLQYVLDEPVILGNDYPKHGVLSVSELFDMDEVFEHLSKYDFYGVEK